MSFDCILNRNTNDLQPCHFKFKNNVKDIIENCVSIIVNFLLHSKQEWKCCEFQIRALSQKEIVPFNRKTGNCMPFYRKHIRSGANKISLVAV